MESKPNRKNWNISLDEERTIWEKELFTQFD